MNRFPHIAAGEGLAEGPGQKATDLSARRASAGGQDHSQAAWVEAYSSLSL